MGKIIVLENWAKFSLEEWIKFFFSRVEIRHGSKTPQVTVSQNRSQPDLVGKPPSGGRQKSKVGVRISFFFSRLRPISDRRNPNPNPLSNQFLHPSRSHVFGIHVTSLLCARRLNRFGLIGRAAGCAQSRGLSKNSVLSR